MSARKYILVVEDDADLADSIRFNLEREGYRTIHAGDGSAALAAIRRETPDLILLDRMLPIVSGDEVVIALRRDPRTPRIPVIVLSAKSDETDELVGFALGVDDYVRKPFSIKSLIARVAAVMRRHAGSDPGTSPVSQGGFSVDTQRHELLVHGIRVALTSTELRVLRALISAQGSVLSRSELINAAIGLGAAITDRTIDVHILAIRKKIKSALPDAAAENWIHTVRGVGYSFRRPVEMPAVPSE